MRRYSEIIEGSRLVRKVHSSTTTGDLEYSGTALEIADEAGNELFHVVVDAAGERQILFFPCGNGYRIPMDLLERILTKAKATVNVPDKGGP